MSRKMLFPVLLALSLILLVACGSASFNDAQMSGASEPSYESDRTQAAVAYDEAPALGESEAMAEEIAFASDTADGANSLTVELTEAQADLSERLIIRNASLSLVVADTEATLGTIAQMAAQSGGWIVNSNVYQYNSDAKSADITIRIPAAGFADAMSALKEMAVEVEHENVSGQDVTEEFVDLGSRLENLEATAARVRSFMEDADTVEEALAVNQELSRLEGEIELIRGRMQYLSQSAAFSTISVVLTPDIVYQPVQVGGWRPQGVAKEAIEALAGTLQALASFAIWAIIYILPIALLIGVPTWLVVRFVWRRWQRRKPQVQSS